MGETFVTNIRLPKEIIEEVDKTVENKYPRYASRNHFMVEAIRDKVDSEK
jgi:metal-responsive CopG/Arc/MetJ family transcriptional regulator